MTAAFEVLADEGLDGLTMRRIAERLAVQNPALYWHFANKQAIIDRMAARLLAQVASDTAEAASGARADWRALLLASARSFRRVLRAHRDGARLVAAADLSRSPMTPSFAAALETLVSAGFEERDALVGIIAVFDYTLGATFEEQEDPVRSAAAKARPGASSTSEKADAWTAAAARLSRALGGDGDVVFEGGLELLLDGLAGRRRDARRWARASRAT